MNESERIVINNIDLPFLKSEAVILPDTDLARFEALICAVVTASGSVSLANFRRDLAVENKDGNGFDPVTEADRACEAFIREQLARDLPTHGVFGEEAGYSPGTEGLTWVVDPIDGTRSYICGVPLWGTLAGLSDGQRPVLGVAYQPFSDELFVGSRLGGRMQQGETSSPLKTTRVTSLSEARLFCTSFDIFTADERPCFDRVAEAARLLRLGADCYAYCLLAAGHADLVVEAGLQCYDIYALVPIIEAAGGVITDWQGGDPSRGGTVVAAATPELHAETLDVLRVGGRG